MPIQCCSTTLSPSKTDHCLHTHFDRVASGHEEDQAHPRAKLSRLTAKPELPPSDCKPGFTHFDSDSEMAARIISLRFCERLARAFPCRAHAADGWNEAGTHPETKHATVRALPSYDASPRRPCDDSCARHGGHSATFGSKTAQNKNLQAERWAQELLLENKLVENS